MTLLIAMEFKHSIIRFALRRGSIIQVKTVILIALLALSRKFIILDTAKTDAANIAALAGATFVLGLCTGCCASVMIGQGLERRTTIQRRHDDHSSPRHVIKYEPSQAVQYE